MDRDAQIDWLIQELTTVRRALDEALQENTRLKERIHELECQQKKDSHNSGLPPSSDRFARRPRSGRERSGKRPGGQSGHQGRSLLQRHDPDQIVVHRPMQCEHCSCDLRLTPARPTARRQVLDLPSHPLQVTEHQVQQVACPECGALCRADFPVGVRAPVQYGPSLQALAVYLSQVQLLPYARVSQVLEDLFGHRLSVASIEGFVIRAHQSLEPVEEALKEALITQDVVNQDETGLYVQGKRHWVHVVSTPQLTHYAHHPKRGREALQAIGIASRLQGLSVHDGWSSYWAYGKGHALCNVHHLRELTFFAEEEHQLWASEMKVLLLLMRELVAQAKARGWNAFAEPMQVVLMEHYQQILEQGYQSVPAPPLARSGKRGKSKQHPVRNLLDRLRIHADAVLAFVRDFRVPFDNNLAERDLRMLKVQQKISGCFRSVQGADAFCRLRSYVSTMRKQGHRLLTALETVLAGAPLFPSFS
ncbi:IS66 family transposase [Ktedonobacter sp. SOSP1-85]|uniref:IS66 family transposase n=1 Tax=Ktedonobacter sp. SOSP1-85 TaxID=2778367 RepID=UPI0019150C06|nr:IS66 family transposase [Ktedonobacter sp. SOSP1-85]